MSELSLFDEAQEPIEKIPAVGAFDVTVTITKNSETEGGTLILALYDADGVMPGTEIDSEFLNGVSNGETAQYRKRVSQIEGKTISQIKMYIWNGMEEITPMSETSVFNQSIL